MTQYDVSRRVFLAELAKDMAALTLACSPWFAALGIPIYMGMQEKNRDRERYLFAVDQNGTQRIYFYGNGKLYLQDAGETVKVNDSHLEEAISQFHYARIWYPAHNSTGATEGFIPEKLRDITDRMTYQIKL